MDSASQHVNFLKIRIANAKTFLLENLTKKPIHAATVFDIFSQTLYFSIARDKKPDSEMEKNEHKGGNNKILEEHQKKAIHLLSDLYLHTSFNLRIKWYSMQLLP